ncbi:MAG TPA: aminotransferase class I/II-fold pyridoxal phosphate-dependent enzyme [Steroidobacteraceae bacterium]|nr:aminotransferase class I/II-fold pyridoxal phosphate-dependent enzyme [Steroidobacteraceae bacterium]
MSRSSAPVHGGPDSGPPIAVDFSTNAHPMGPNPWIDECIRRADRSRYPDPGYAALRASLGEFHRAAPERVVIGASASELIWRLTRAWGALRRAAVVTSQRTFGEYLRAARALGLPVRADTRTAAQAHLLWCCNPDNPSGEIRDEEIAGAVQSMVTPRGSRGVIAADLAYWPFRQLLGARASLQLDTPWSNEVVQLWSPNKLHGLTGVRAAYLILPASCRHLGRAELDSLAPSWPLGADGLALLTAHTQREARRFLNDTGPKLREWKALQDRRLLEAGWKPQVSQMHFGLWQPPVPRAAQKAWHAQLRLSGIKVRDARSFGRPGWVRLVTRAPQQVEDLIAITNRCAGHRHRLTPAG